MRQGEGDTPRSERQPLPYTSLVSGLWFRGVGGPNTSFVVGLIGMVSLEFVAKRHNIAAESVQKETASLLKRDCRARAKKPTAKQRGEIDKKAARARWIISQSG